MPYVDYLAERSRSLRRIVLMIALDRQRWALLPGFCVCILAACVIPSCRETLSPDPPFERWLYYCLDSSASGRSQAVGLYRIALSDDHREQLESHPVYAISSAAANGIILFQKGSDGLSYQGMQQVLFGKCENGSIIPVPFPVSSRPDSEYVYALPPSATLAYNGHHAVYPVLLKPVASSLPESKRPRLVLFNCAKGEMTIIDLLDYLKMKFQPDTVTAVVITGSNLIISDDGKKIFLTVELRRNGNRSSYQLLEWADTLRTIGGTSSSGIDISGYDGSSGSLYVHIGGDLFRVPTSTGEYLPALRGGFPSPFQFSRRRGEIAQVNGTTIGLFNAANANWSRNICTFEEIGARFARQYYAAHSKVRIAPDGEWISVAAARTDTIPILYDLIIMRRDGTEMHRVAEDIALKEFILSDAVPPT